MAAVFFLTAESFSNKECFLHWFHFRGKEEEEEESHHSSRPEFLCFFSFFLEAEHGYATSLPVLSQEYQNPKSVRLSKITKKPQGGSR